MQGVMEFYRDLANTKDDMMKGSGNDKTMSLRDILLKLKVNIEYLTHRNIK